LGKSALTIRLAAALAGLALPVALLAAAPARAQDEDSAAVEKITKLNKKAVDEFENLNFDQARKLLKDALDAASRAGLEKSQVAARTHVHLGVVLFAGFKQKDDALAEFKKALEIAPDVKLDKLLATPEIQEVFDQAVSEQKSSGGETTPASADAITHEPVTVSTQGKPIPINMTLDSSVKAKKVILSFSADGSEDFGEREMKEASPGNWMGEIPSSATEGAKVSYYIEVQGDDDQTLASKGSATSPLVVTLRGGVAKKRPPPPPPEKKEETGAPTWYFAFGLGTGFGWTTGQGEINKGDASITDAMGRQIDLPPGDKVDPAGFAWARLGQIAPEVGYYLTPELMLSLQVRLQFVSGATPFYSPTCGASGLCAPPSLSVAGFARAHYFLSLEDSPLHPFVAGMVGGGQIRHVATFNSHPVCGIDMHTPCVDTIPAGPVFVGGGGGFLFNLSPSFALTAEADAVAGFTDFTINFDVNVGVAILY
jgi:hypothetical protein